MSQENVDLVRRAVDAFNRRGKCIWWRAFATRDEALEAMGLSEQNAHADS